MPALSGEKATSLTLGGVLLCIGLATILLGRPSEGEDIRTFMRSSLLFADYSAMILAFIAFGVRIIEMNL